MTMKGHKTTMEYAYRVLTIDILITQGVGDVAPSNNLRAGASPGVGKGAWLRSEDHLSPREPVPPPTCQSSNLGDPAQDFSSKVEASTEASTLQLRGAVAIYCQVAGKTVWTASDADATANPCRPITNTYIMNGSTLRLRRRMADEDGVTEDPGYAFKHAQHMPRRVMQ
ncbi:hypothetical protein BJV78DRAFT_1152929 [Lactifluus subvellereus]|nr:hypothetical protein BJV78DRAFT_1152929 [Lactifluus subvellereus]